ncbi:MAG: DUF2726 domain-containing protein [Nitrospira sp.]|nr:DUF2726 domain-containing protein [Nitrospira sp.]MBH0182459.1 DUF2726 domain-containing protein [Nitrospira sp.]MBH0185352.1 DUF2726 domain-containing protein [Nitrospira sp.]
MFSLSKKTPGPSTGFSLPPGTAVVSAPLLTEAGIALYNLLQMAAQDRYLIFADVPLWSFVSVEATGKSRLTLLNHMALKRVDFVLVHPGTRHVEQVVQLEDTSPGPHQVERQRVIESVLDAAGIKLVTVRATKSYTIPEITALLGLATDE